MEEKKCDIREESLEKVAGGGSSVTMVCPYCGKSMSCSLSSTSVVCPNCNYHFTIDRIRTDKRLEQLKKIEKEQEKGR